MTQSQAKLHVIRHGQTAWSISGQHTGRTDIPLTTHGEAEARALAPWLRAIRFSHVFVSPLHRARQTCALSGLDAGSIVEPDLAEWDYGSYEGKLTAEIREDRPDWSPFRDGCPGGESPSQISDRADRLIARLIQLDGAIALFSHGEFSGVLAARWIGLPVSLGPSFPLSTASLNILGHNPVHPETRSIALWNAVPGMLRI